MLFTPLPLSQTVTPSRTPSPSSVTYCMDGPSSVMSWTHGVIAVAQLHATVFAFVWACLEEDDSC